METPKITFSAEKKKSLITKSSKFLSAHDFSLTEKEIAKASRELSESEENRIRCLRKLREKLEGDEGENYRTDEEYLLRYLRVRKFDYSKAYENIKTAHLFMKKNPEYLKLPSNLESLLKLNFYYYLPYIDEKGHVLLFMDIAKWNPKETSFTELMYISQAVSDIIFMNPRCQVNGLIVIWDMKAINRHHIVEIVRNINVGALVGYLQNYYPLRLKNVYVVNTGGLSQFIFQLVRPFLKKQLSERVAFFGTDLEELHRVVNPAILPRALGGALEEEQCSVVHNLLSNIHYLKYEHSFI